MAKDLKLFTVPGTNNHDLLIENFDLQLIDGKDAVRQALEVGLKFFFGEWFLDNTVGVKYFDYIFVKNPNILLVEAVIKTRILNTRDVNKLLSYSQEISNGIRKLNVSFEVDTTFGTVGANVSVP